MHFQILIERSFG
jgi:hypothetical protein